MCYTEVTEKLLQHIEKPRFQFHECRLWKICFCRTEQDDHLLTGHIQTQHKPFPLLINVKSQFELTISKIKFEISPVALLRN
jgi:hypothetical protein